VERTTLFIDVILPLPLPGTFTYRVPHNLNHHVEPGKRVVVQFGRSKIYTALVYRIHENPPEKYMAKYIVSVLDPKPIVNTKQFEFWNWMASYYMCYLGDVMNVSLPSGLKLQSESKVILHNEFDHDLSNLNEKEFLIAEALEIQHEVSISDVSKIIDQLKVIPLLKTMIEKKIIQIKEELIEQYKPKIESFVTLADKYSDEHLLNKVFDELSKRAYKQLELLISFIQLSNYGKETTLEVSRSELIKKADASYGQLNSLVKKGIFVIYEKEIPRLEEFSSYSRVDSIVFGDQQQSAYDSINKNLETKDVVLLHGVTSSGKTEIYIKLIEECITQGNQVLYLLPEIALTTQIINRLRKYFGNRIGVYHSKYNEFERVEIWNKVLSRKKDHFTEDTDYQIILGARSSLFLPYSNLGLIIVDESYDTSYKQFDPAPRYNARDSAIYLALLHKAKVVLGSATPALESYFNAQKNKYALVELTERYGGVKLPEIVIVDLKKATRRKEMKSIFSDHLLKEIRLAIKKKEQVILFQNRRGFSLRLECDSCSWMPECVNCDVTLIYHKHQNRLRCHYCGYSTQVPFKCPECDSNHLSMRGFGTEKVEEELATIFPEIRIVRMDMDTTRTRNAYQHIINDFEERKIDILVGTQMVTKGLDFDNVSIVSILNADNMINFPDFRSYERSFQLMSQVSGRAGRKLKRGKVLIQTYNPEHPVIKFVLENDYLGMFNNQLVDRKKFKYPPFYRLIRIILKHKEPKTLNRASKILSDQLRSRLGKRIIGPEYPIIPRIKNQYIKHILVKMEREASGSKIKTEILKQIDVFQEDKENRSVRVILDVDPM